MAIKLLNKKHLVILRPGGIGDFVLFARDFYRVWALYPAGEWMITLVGSRLWKDHVEIDNSLMRPKDIMSGIGKPDKAYEKLRWRAKYGMKDVVRMMIEAERK